MNFFISKHSNNEKLIEFAKIKFYTQNLKELRNKLLIILKV